MSRRSAPGEGNLRRYVARELCQTGGTFSAAIPGREFYPGAMTLSCSFRCDSRASTAPCSARLMRSTTRGRSGAAAAGFRRRGSNAFIHANAAVSGLRGGSQPARGAAGTHEQKRQLGHNRSVRHKLVAAAWSQSLAPRAHSAIYFPVAARRALTRCHQASAAGDFQALRDDPRGDAAASGDDQLRIVPTPPRRSA